MLGDVRTNDPSSVITPHSRSVRRPPRSVSRQPYKLTNKIGLDAPGRFPTPSPRPHHPLSPTSPHAARQTTLALKTWNSLTLAMMLLLVALAALSSAHFVLELPTSVGFEDVKAGTPPCGGFDITTRSTVTEWPIAGAPLKVISTHPRSEFTIQAALLPNTTGDSPDFVKLVPIVRQGGLGALCLTAVPGLAAWEGKDAVLQVIQAATDGQNFQVSGNSPLWPLAYF